MPGIPPHTSSRTFFRQRRPIQECSTRSASLQSVTELRSGIIVWPEVQVGNKSWPRVRMRGSELLGSSVERWNGEILFHKIN